MLGSLIKLGIGAAVVGAVGYLGYQRYYGSTAAFACDVSTPWYLPTPKFSCGQKTSSGEITGLQYQAGEWVYQFTNGHFGKEAAMTLKALSGAVVAIL
jgi:hypothetical protein